MIRFDIVFFSIMSFFLPLNSKLLVTSYQSQCQYNEDCPPDQLCDRLNRVCKTPCTHDSCGENAECVPLNHAATCRCNSGFTGNPYVKCGKGMDVCSAIIMQ